MADPGELARLLAQVQDRLLALPDDAFGERWELRRQQDELRSKAASFAVVGDETRSDGDLLRELGALRQQMRAIERQRIDIVSQSGGSGGSTSEMGNLGALKLNRAMDEAAGLLKIRERIGLIKGILIDRGVEAPSPD